MKIKPSLVTSLAICFIAFAVFMLTRTLDTDSEPQNFAPPLSLIDIENRQHRLDQYKGQLLIVNFWASWCGPCKEEIPSMNRANILLKDSKVQMLAINYGEDKSTVQKFLKHTPIDFPVLLDSQNIASKAWNITAMPTTIIVNRSGVIIETVVGSRDWDSPQVIQGILAIDNN